MISHMHGKLPPYKLIDGIVYFHDWRYVSHGGLTWQDEQGNSVQLMGTQPYPPMVCIQHDIPLGIELVAQKARKTEPVFTPENAKEPFVMGGTVMRDSGKYRMWYGSRLLTQVDADKRMTNHGEISESIPISILINELGEFRYAESDDGFDWRFPSLELVVATESGRHNNVVSDKGGGHVFIDESAPPSERYKMIYRGYINDEQLARYRRERPDEVDPSAIRDGGADVLAGAVSPDGLDWTHLTEPLVVQFVDTYNLCEYDPVRESYVAYTRSWFFNRRTIARNESKNFRSFPMGDELFWPNADMKPYDLWYTNSKTKLPGTQTYHVMFPAKWSLLTDQRVSHLAASPDNVVWSMVPGGAVCEEGEPGTWDAAEAIAQPDMVELPDGSWGLLYTGIALPHKHPRRPPYGGLAWAWWPKGRLVALRASEIGSFALWPLETTGRTVHLNFNTALAGYVKVEVVGQDGQSVPGRSFEDCDPLSGDHLDRTVTWHGESGINMPEGTPVRLRFNLHKTDLYSVRFA